MKNIIKIIIIIILAMFGLYSCDESTVTEPKEDTKVEEKKYTLEEILADTNWVEITDTLHYESRHLIGYSYLYENWTMFSVIKFNTLDEYKKIETMSDTTSQWYVKGALKYDIDFDKYTLLGVRAYKYENKNIKKIFRNNNIKQYHYFIIIPDTIRTLAGITDYNFIKVPKVQEEYKISADTLLIKGYN